jgi:hypothetical protein
MGKCGTFFLLFLLFYGAGVAWQLSLMFLPEQCEPGGGENCLTPLFHSTDKVDLCGIRPPARSPTPTASSASPLH